MYPVEAYGLEGYVNYRELSCAVCRTSSYGSLFTHWGKTVCPSGSTTIYGHRVAAAHSGHGGGGANYLCMHPTPQWLHTTGTDSPGVCPYCQVACSQRLSHNSRTLFSLQAQIYQVEYRTGAWSFLAQLQYYEATCSLCGTATAHKQTVMLPARTSCPSGMFRVVSFRKFSHSSSGMPTHCCAIHIYSRIYGELQRISGRVVLHRFSDGYGLSVKLA